MEKPCLISCKSCKTVPHESLPTAFMISLPLIGSLGWLTIKEMIEFEIATTVYMSLHELAPEYMQLMFTKLSENTSRSLRNTDTDLRIPRFSTSHGQRSFPYRGVTVWNKLSTEIKKAQFAETIFEKSKGMKVLAQHQTFSFPTRIYCILTLSPPEGPYSPTVFIENCEFFRG